MTLLTVDGETCMIELASGPTPFRSTSVKPYLRPDHEPDLEPTFLPQRQPDVETPPQNAISQPAPKRGRGRPRKYPLLTAMADITIYLQDDTTQFRASYQEELAGLLEKGVFEIVNLATIPQGVRIFNSRFVDEIKNLAPIQPLRSPDWSSRRTMTRKRTLC